MSRSSARWRRRPRPLPCAAMPPKRRRSTRLLQPWRRSGACRTWSSTTRATACAGRSPRSRRRKSSARWRSAPSLDFSSASVKGYANSAPFAMGKFALRGLAQSMARELAPKGIHVAHFVIDGGIRHAPADPRADERGDDGMLLPDEIAKNYLHVYRQHRSAWTWELELRPWVERF